MSDMENFKDYPNMDAWIRSRQFCDSDEVYTNGAELITVNNVLKGWNYYMSLERAKVLDEVKNSIHTIYSQNLYCKEDMCENCTMGYDCEDCLATFLMGYIEDVMKSHK